MAEEAVDDIDELFDDEDGVINEITTNDGDEYDGPLPANDDASSQLPAVVRKRVIKTPRVKLNADRLCGERGLPALAEHFKNVKFKGKGHQAENLRLLLSNLQHWTHRLFPSMKFKDSIQHIEKLGKKKQVQACLRKIRHDIPVLNEDLARDEVDDDVLRMENSDNDIDFDQLIEKRQQSMEALNASESQNSAPSLDTPSCSTSTGLTEEQRKRIEHNKMLAAERRKSSMAAAISLLAEHERLNGSSFEPPKPIQPPLSAMDKAMLYATQRDGALLANLSDDDEGQTGSVEDSDYYDSKHERLRNGGECISSAACALSYDTDSSESDNETAFTSLENIIEQVPADESVMECDSVDINPNADDSGEPVKHNLKAGDKENINDH